MITAYQIRSYFEDHTRSVFVALDGDGNHILTCVILELPWRDNAFRISCIPEGKYKVKRRWTNKFGWHYHIQDVKNRTYILQHPGNYTYQIEGCQLPGTEIKHMNKDKTPDVSTSRVTLNKMLKAFGSEYTLYIGSFAPPTHPHNTPPDYLSSNQPTT